MTTSWSHTWGARCCATAASCCQKASSNASFPKFSSLAMESVLLSGTKFCRWDFLHKITSQSNTNSSTHKNLTSAYYIRQIGLYCLVSSVSVSNRFHLAVNVDERLVGGHEHRFRAMQIAHRVDDAGAVVRRHRVTNPGAGTALRVAAPPPTLRSHHKVAP